MKPKYKFFTVETRMTVNVKWLVCAKTHAAAQEIAAARTVEATRPKHPKSAFGRVLDEESRLVIGAIVRCDENGKEHE